MRMCVLVFDFVSLNQWFHFLFHSWIQFSLLMVLATLRLQLLQSSKFFKRFLYFYVITIFYMNFRIFKVDNQLYVLILFFFRPSASASRFRAVPGPGIDATVEILFEARSTITGNSVNDRLKSAEPPLTGRILLLIQKFIFIINQYTFEHYYCIIFQLQFSFAFRCSVVRLSQYDTSVKTLKNVKPWKPAANFLFFPDWQLILTVVLSVFGVIIVITIVILSVLAFKWVCPSSVSARPVCCVSLSVLRSPAVPCVRFAQILQVEIQFERRRRPKEALRHHIFCC